MPPKTYCHARHARKHALVRAHGSTRATRDDCGTDCSTKLHTAHALTHTDLQEAVRMAAHEYTTAAASTHANRGFASMRPSASPAASSSTNPKRMTGQSCIPGQIRVPRKGSAAKKSKGSAASVPRNRAGARCVVCGLKSTLRGLCSNFE
jgi:hypothetical protein